jgi:hypothetical protein
MRAKDPNHGNASEDANTLTVGQIQGSVQVLSRRPGEAPNATHPVPSLVELHWQKRTAFGVMEAKKVSPESNPGDKHARPTVTHAWQTITQ